MKVVVQRVLEASVSVSGKQVSAIKQGYLLYVGFTHDDTLEEVSYIARKVANLRIFSDSEGKMNLSLAQTNGEILSISQFTLYGDTRKSNRPSFTQAMDYQKADMLYQSFNQMLESEYGINVHGGVFGDHMQIASINDGPVTIIIEK
ncbi:MAG TPA: D-aminoacyl-tRNA deacylase [Bacillota bacterium]|nr:D-aminoacyl-tRNA deacylase [Bacillota bacterium]HPJ23454.1 D-aminoacyl-tRNA deacylase [Bacillota bacterium]